MTSIILACTVVGVGLYGLLTRRHLVAILASVEVMLGGSQLLMVSYAALSADPALLQGVSLIVLATTAAEAAVGLALSMALVRRGRTRIDELREVRG